MWGGPCPCSGKARFDSTLDIRQVEDLHSIGKTREIINYFVTTLQEKKVEGGWRGNLWKPMKKLRIRETQINQIETVKDISS